MLGVLSHLNNYLVVGLHTFCEIFFISPSIVLRRYWLTSDESPAFSRLSNLGQTSQLSSLSLHFATHNNREEGLVVTILLE